MAKGNEKDKKDIETWLLNFEKQVSKPVVITLLIQNNAIDFISCIDKKRFMDLEGLDSDEEVNDKMIDKHQNKFMSLRETKSYIG